MGALLSSLSAAVSLVLLTLVSPARAMPVLGRLQPLGLLTWLLVGAAFAETLAAVLVTRARTGASFGLEFLVLGTLVNLGFLLLLLGVGAIFLPFAAVNVLGGRGKSGPFFWALGLSYGPWALWIALGPALRIGPAGAVAALFAKLLLVAWILSVQVRAVRAGFGLTALRALFATALGYGMAAVLFLSASFLGFAGFFHLVTLWAPRV